MEMKNINRCLGGLRMEDQGERSPQTFLVNNFAGETLIDSHYLAQYPPITIY